jgi:hypothetical protein
MSSVAPMSETLDTFESELLSLVLQDEGSRMLPACSRTSLGVETSKQRDDACVQAAAATRLKTETHLQVGNLTVSNLTSATPDQALPTIFVLSSEHSSCQPHPHKLAKPDAHEAMKLEMGPSRASQRIELQRSTSARGVMHAPHVAVQREESPFHGTNVRLANSTLEGTLIPKDGREREPVGDADTTAHSLREPLQQERCPSGKCNARQSDLQTACLGKKIAKKGEVDESSLRGRCASATSASSSELRAALHQRMQHLKVRPIT